jgi:hypothetical protein
MLDESVLEEAVALWKKGKKLSVVADSLNISVYSVWMAVKRYKLFGTTKQLSKHNLNIKIKDYLMLKHKNNLSAVDLATFSFDTIKLKRLLISLLENFQVQDYHKIMNILELTVNAYRNSTDSLFGNLLILILISFLFLFFLIRITIFIFILNL